MARVKLIDDRGCVGPEGSATAYGKSFRALHKNIDYNGLVADGDIERYEVLSITERSVELGEPRDQRLMFKTRFLVLKEQSATAYDKSLIVCISVLLLTALRSSTKEPVALQLVTNEENMIVERNRIRFLFYFFRKHIFLFQKTSFFLQIRWKQRNPMEPM